MVGCDQTGRFDLVTDEGCVVEPRGWFARQNDDGSWALWFQGHGLQLSIEDLEFPSEYGALTFAQRELIGVGLFPDYGAGTVYDPVHPFP